MIAIVCLTQAGSQIAARLRSPLGAQTWAPATLEADRTFTTGICDAITELWPVADQIIVIAAMGIVVRAIAPLLEAKDRDPAVVVVDEAGQFAITVVGGHSAGGDAIAHQVAALLGGTAVLTGASAAQQRLAVDLIGKPYGWQRGQGNWTGVAAAPNVSVIQEVGSRLWLEDAHASTFKLLDETETYEDAEALLWISDRVLPELTIPAVAWHPHTLWLGIGCERGTDVGLIETAIRETLAGHNLAFEAIAGLATLTLKHDEAALLTLSERYHWPLRCFEAEVLAQQITPNPSQVVANEVGTPSVAEAAALVAAHTPELVVTKQVFKGAGACTIAIARSAHSYSPRQGKLFLIGSGPGDLAQLTPAARLALSQADVVMGYQLYLGLLRPLARPGQVWQSSQITQEVQRAEAAIALAEIGLTVAMVSSGDCGIYGMAGLVLERLELSLDVEVFPGITALQAAAARVGAPLMHDFCAISLSDLLTPWPVIETRLKAAAAADFVIALYNPRSQTRQQGLVIALDILRQHRPATTPVAIAKSVYRDTEDITLTTLADFNPERVDMLTVVLIGNRSTTLKYGRMVTPRGYAHKI